MAGIIKTVGIIGTGTIGSSWTGLFLSKGLKVLVSDPAPGAEKLLNEHLERYWPVLEEIGLAPGASLKNCKFVGASLEKHYGEVDFIQENAPEKPEIKNKLIGEIDAGARPEVVIASSSSGIPSSQFISQCKKHPERVLIGHPFNPPHLMPLVEVVPHPGTSKEATSKALEIYAALDKAPVLVKKEIPGHAANRLQAALMQEAYSLVGNDVLSAKDLDACITTSLGPRWALVGPYMSLVSGGGGGRGGFKHMMEHIGPAAQGWLKDMAERNLPFDDALIAKMDKSVQEELNEFDPATVEKQRDEALVKLVKLKHTTGASMLV
ncbi:hypothetical protein PRZ48_011111 [Zasmidium cellare]|uniref:3-hydroxyacyl-CoA dehydrogenase n=1 Tax=Zasmidium cellare TaxID=395010 RepID=A0ABR0EAH5_ZASCE|nr:hypothetical protein PRZ48_011111 [Zasmidium cellare]